MKRKIYFFESNVPMDKTIYLPLVSGLLQAYAQTFPVIKENYDFQPYIFIRDTPENMISNVKDPFLMAFSICIWNHQLSLAVAKLVKERYPKCLIVFGGPQITNADKPYCDYIIKEEGEKKFVNLLAELIGEKISTEEHNLQSYPSPYTLGLYDRYTIDYPEMTFQAIVETNRGCPFTCSFCYWGQGFEEKKVRYHDLDHVRQESEWIGRNRIKYVFMADANFGMFERDQEVAKIYCEIKEKYGYPDKVRVCYGKNKEENVFKTAKILHSHGLAKAITLAKQSNDPETLKNIKRGNIKLSTYQALQDRYAAEGIPTYTEIILGLPGETIETFKKGIQEIIEKPTKLFVYHCTILPNTEMADPEYIRKHGIITAKVPMAEIHGSIRNSEFVMEYEDIIIGTNTMTVEEWVECAVYAWETQLRCVFGVERIPIAEHYRFIDIAKGITKGESRGQIDRRYCGVYVEPEEAAFMRMMIGTGEAGKWCKENNKILNDYFKEFVLWGRKSKILKVKEMV